MTWMMSPDRGLKSSKSAKQHMTQAHAILKTKWQTVTTYAEGVKYLPPTNKSYLNNVNCIVSTTMRPLLYFLISAIRFAPELHQLSEEASQCPEEGSWSQEKTVR